MNVPSPPTTVISWVSCHDPGDYLEKTAEKASSLGMSEDKVDEEIAVVLGLQALQASLEYAKKHGTKRAKR